MSDPVESLVAYYNRVCPMPPLWHRLWEMLPNRTRVGAGWQPPLPLILAAWHDTPAMQWAAQHGAPDNTQIAHLVNS